MSNKKRTLKRTLLGILITVVVFVVLVIVFISPITKYLIEKYDEKYTGRQITLNWAYVNPFTGYIHLSNFKVYEAQSDSVFFAMKGISVNFEIFKAIGKTYEISSLTVDEPYAKIIQDHQHFNFSDLLERFKPKEPADTTKPPVHFNLLDVEVKGGEFHYIESSIPVNYFVKAFNVKTPGMKWNVDTVTGEYSVQNGPSTGEIKGDFTMNMKKMDYRVSAIIKNFDLQIIEQYLKDLANYGTFSAFLDADIKAAGNLNNTLDMNANGFLAVRDFHFGKRKGEDYVSFNRFAVDMTEVNPGAFKYYIDSVMLDKPFFRFEKYDYLDNVQRMFGVGGSNIKAVQADNTKFNLIIEVSDFMNQIAKNFLKSYYKIGKIALYNGDIGFNDFSPREKFAISAKPLNILIDSMDKNYPWMNLKMNTGLKPYGSISVGVKINPNNYGDFSVAYSVQKIPLAVLNPYLITYTSFPLDRGTVSLEGNWTVRDSIINSTNRLLVLDPKHAKKVRKKDTKWIPIPLLLSIVRAPSNAIDFEIPIRGSLKDTKFVLKDALWDVITNLFVKPPLTPYLIRTRQVETEVEKYLTLKWETRQTDLRRSQEKFVKRVANFVADNPEASLVVTPVIFKDKEREYVLFFQAKKKFFMRDRQDGAFSEDDSIVVDKMSVKDPEFLKYLDKVAKDTLLFTVQEKCRVLVGEAAWDKAFKQLGNTRQDVFLSYFDSSDIKRMKIKEEEYAVPFNGFSYYRISYKGELPGALREAYEDMMEINSNDPRVKYQKERRRNRDVLKKTI